MKVYILKRNSISIPEFGDVIQVECNQTMFSDFTNRTMIMRDKFLFFIFPNTPEFEEWIRHEDLQQSMGHYRYFPLFPIADFTERKIGDKTYLVHKDVENGDRETTKDYVLKNAKPAASSQQYHEDTTETESFVIEALQQLSIGNDGDATYHPLYKAWQSYRRNPSQLKSINDFGKYGMGLMILLSYGTVNDIDDRQQIASISYLFLSKAIIQKPSDVNLLKNRLILMITNHEAFEYTVSSVVNKGVGFIFSSLQPFKARDAMFKMEYADLSKDSRLLTIDLLSSKYKELRNKISTHFFGTNETDNSIIKSGEKHHTDVLKYIENKVLEEEDIDF
jgi:hypothetical protein